MAAGRVTGISIPKGSIKRKKALAGGVHLQQFQFQKVRLKDFIIRYDGETDLLFQFQKVRLKGDHFNVIYQFKAYFNSKRFD